MANSPLKTERRYISRAQCAEYFDISKATVDRLIRDRTITAHRLGPRLIRIDLTEVQGILGAPTTEGTANNA